MPTTSNLSLPYPDPTNAPNVPYDIQALAQAIDIGLAAVAVTYAPTLAGTIINPTGYVGTGRYIRIGDLVTFWFNITAGAGFVAGSGVYNLSLPVPRANAGPLSISAASCLLYDSSASAPNFNVSPTAGSSANVNFATFQCLAGGILQAVSATVPWAWAVGDQLSGCLIYEAA